MVEEITGGVFMDVPSLSLMAIEMGILGVLQTGKVLLKT